MNSEDNKRRFRTARAQEGSLIERQALRFIAIAIAVLTMIAAVQLFVTYTFTGYESWIQQVIPNKVLGEAIIITPFICGSILLAGKLIRRRQVILIGLFSLWVYNLAMALLNGVTFKFQGSPMMLYLTIGVLTLIMYSYYQNRDDYDKPYREKAIQMTKGDIE